MARRSTSKRRTSPPPTTTWAPRSSSVTNDEDARTTSKDSAAVTLLIHTLFLFFALALLQQCLPLSTTTFLAEQLHLPLPFQPTVLTLPTVSLGVLEVSFLLLVGMWFYTQSSHESREHAYYFAGSGPTPSDLVAHGLGPLPDSATGQSLYLDTMKRSLLVSSLGSGLKPVFVVFFSWVAGWVVCVCSSDLSRLSL